MVDLSGTWRAAIADEELRRSFTDVDADDDTWQPVEVPGHWRTEPAFSDSDGPLLYRTRFGQPDPDRLIGTDDLDPAIPADQRRWWLTFDGIFYQGDVWLDGEYLAATEGYFFAHELEVTTQIASRAEHLLAVEVTCEPQRDRAAKRNLTGVFQHWDLIDPAWNPGGIWRPVSLRPTGPVRIRHFRPICTEATEESATLDLRAVLLVDEPRTVELVTSIGGIEHREEHTLAAGENRVEWRLPIPAPRLWWPWSLGDQPLYDLDVTASIDGTVSDRRSRRIGLRSVELRDWVFHVNGERLFVHGTNHGPTDLALGTTPPERIAEDIRLAKAANLDLVRVHAHVTRPELYEAADEEGVLLWQDMPLQWGYSRTIRHEARRQARELVDRLAHHPSVVLWCGHNEPLAVDISPDTIDDPALQRRTAARLAAAMMLPTWNKTVLDHSIRRVLTKTDGSRPVVAHSGVLPHPPLFSGTDSHLYFGWYFGKERQFPTAMRAWPRLARFVSEFGAQAVPDRADFMEPERWPDLDWERLIHHHSLQKAVFDRFVPPTDFATFDEWCEATQAYQATVIKHHIETLRALKYRPCGGYLHFCLADVMPSVTWSVLDHERRPKAGYETLAQASAPVIIVAQRLPEVLHAGAPLALDVHAVSDLRFDRKGVRATARLRWPGGHRTWQWEGDLPADDCVRIGRVDQAVPRTTGPFRLTLELHGAGVEATNEYESIIVAP